jgi:hypothetical protein
MAVLVAGALAACSSEGEGGGLNEQPLPTAKSPTVTVLSPEDINQQTVDSGYALKAMAVEDPTTPASGVEVKAESRLMAVQVELENISSDDAMTVDVANAVVTDDKGIDYPALAGGRDGEIKSTDLKKGERASGWMAFQVPKDAKLKSVTYRIGLLTSIALTAELPQK